MKSQPTSIGQLARTPKWIALLLLALAVAAVFAWLGKWQVERAIIQAAQSEYDTEVAVNLETIAQPGEPITTDQAGRRVYVEATLDLGSLIVVGNRVNDGATGCWVTGRLVGNEGALAVALGWAPTIKDCQMVRNDMSSEVVIQALVKWTGRYSPSEMPEVPSAGTDPNQLNYMSVPALYELWVDSPAPVFAGYLVSEEVAPGLTKIVSTPPITDASLNLLNIFYAVEWILFAAGAVFLWYRLLRDDFQKRNEP